MVFNRKDLGKAFSPSKGRRVHPRENGRHSPRLNLSASYRAPARPAPGAKRPVPVSGGGSSANMKVVVRVRPMSSREVESNAREIVKVVDEKMVIFDPKEENNSFFFHGAKQKGRDMLKKENKNAQFLFDRVFGMDSTNEEVFLGSTKDIVSSVLDGFNCSVFVYGATGAGKTFTMLGTKENPGITFRTMVDLFEQIDAQKSEKDFEIGVSYLEVYNENVHDLISPSTALHLREDANGVVVAGLKMEMISQPERMLELLEHGNKNRSQHPTDANAESSRSHAVFQVFLKMTAKATGQAKLVKLSMIDLAGSERGAATGCAGARFKEGSNINKSLLALGNCINALADGLRHIPYRDSKLTRLLKDSLGGNCQTVMIANVSPAGSTFEDTHNTLKYATRAKKIKFKIKRNIVSVELHVSNYIKMVEDLQGENTKLKAENAKLQKDLKDLQMSSAAKGGQMKKLVEQPAATDAAPAPTVVGVAVNTSPVKVDTKVENEVLNGLMEQAQQLFEEKEQLQLRYLNMDSSEKLLKWRIQFKQRTISRVGAMSSTPERVEVAQAKVDGSLKQFNGRLVSANECQDVLALQQKEIDLKLESLKRDVKLLGLMDEFTLQLNNLELKFAKRELQYQCQHLEKLVNLLDEERENQDQVLQEISGPFRLYYNLLRGHGHMTSTMLTQHQSLIRRLEGVRGVTWEEDNEKTKPSLGRIRSPVLRKITKLSFGDAQSPVFETTSFVKSLQSRSPPAASIAELHPGTNASCSPVRPTSPLLGSLATEDQSKGFIIGSPMPVLLVTDVEPSSCIDTATMLDSLGQLDTKVENLLNTSIALAVSEAENNLQVSPEDTEQGTCALNSTFNKLCTQSPNLNVTFDAGDNLNVTFNKESDMNRTFDKCDDLNKTFDRIEVETPRVLNSSFSISGSDSPSARCNPVPEPAPAPTPPRPVTVVSTTGKSTSSPVLAAPSTTGKSTSSAKFAVPSALAAPSVTGKSTSSPKVAVPSASAAPSTSGKSTSSAKFAVPSASAAASSVRGVGAAAPLPKRPGEKSDVLSSNPAVSRMVSSSKLHGVKRQMGSAAKMMSSTPSKYKKAWNKENRNTGSTAVTASTKLVRTNPVTKLVSTAGVNRNTAMAVKQNPRNPLNDTFTKASPKGKL